MPVPQWMLRWPSSLLAWNGWKKGLLNRVVTAKRDRLLIIMGRREQWRDDLTLVRRLHADVVEAEAILSGAKLEAQHEPVTNAAVRTQYDAW